jgi:hypothetical protein
MYVFSICAFFVAMYTSSWYSSSIHTPCSKGKFPFTQTPCLTELFENVYVAILGSAATSTALLLHSFYAFGFVKPSGILRCLQRCRHFIDYGAPSDNRKYLHKL